MWKKAKQAVSSDLFDFNLRIWRRFFDSEMASIVSLAPSGLFPGGEVAGSRP
jgi:hypothetical protein